MCHDAHGDEDDQQVHPDGEIGHPAVGLKGADLGDEEAGADKQDWADDVAQPELGHLRRCSRRSGW